MKEILEKLKKVKDEILLEKKDGKLRLLALIARADLENKWDILLSADWLKKTNGEDDLVYLIEKLRSEFDNKLSFLASVVSATPNETFIRQLARAVLKEGRSGVEEISDLSTSDNFAVKQAFIVAIDFEGINLDNDGVDEGPLAIKEITDF